MKYQDGTHPSGEGAKPVTSEDAKWCGLSIRYPKSFRYLARTRGNVDARVEPGTTALASEPAFAPCQSPSSSKVPCIPLSTLHRNGSGVLFRCQLLQRPEVGVRALPSSFIAHPSLSGCQWRSTCASRLGCRTCATGMHCQIFPELAPHAVMAIARRSQVQALNGLLGATRRSGTPTEGGEPWFRCANGDTCGGLERY